MPGFLVDENLPGLLAEELAARGFLAEHVADNNLLRSANDEQILLYAKRQGLIVISKDKDFSDIVRYPLGSHAGIVCVRLPNRISIGEQVRLVISGITAVGADELVGALVVVEPGRIRVRR